MGIAFDPCHCPATLLPLGLGPEQAVPTFLMAYTRLALGANQ